MAEEQKYPETVVRRGSPIVFTKAISHYCMLKKIKDMRDKIGHDAYDDIERNSQLGVILKLAGAEFTWAGKHVQYLFANMLYISKKSEIWVLVAPGRPLRFSLHEFEHITQLNCGVRAAGDGEFVQGELWGEMGLSHGNGPTWADLEAALRRCKDWSFEKRKMVGLLVVLHVAIFGLHPSSRLSAYHAKLVMDQERFERHPWGRVAFEILISSIPRAARQLNGSSYTLHGLVPALLVWAFEYIPALGIAAGERRRGDIPLLRWSGRRSRGLETEAILDHYRASSDNKVRVINMVVKPYEEIYPKWDGDIDDPQVDRMIKDILDRKLDETFWDIEDSPADGPKLKKRKAESSDQREISVEKKPTKVRETEKSGRAHELVEPTKCTQEKETLKLAENPTMAEFKKEATREKEIKAMREWRKEYEARKESEERDKKLMSDMLETMKVTLDVMRQDQLTNAERVRRLEEESIGRESEAKIDKRLRMMEEYISKQDYINERLISLLDKGQPTPPLALPEKTDSIAVDDADEDKRVRKSLLDYDAETYRRQQRNREVQFDDLYEPSREEYENPSSFPEENNNPTSPLLSAPLRLPYEQKDWLFERQETSDPLTPELRIVKNPGITSKLKTPALKDDPEATPPFVDDNNDDDDDECRILEIPKQSGSESDLVFIDDGVLLKPSRPRHLAVNQKSPYEGNSTVKRIMPFSLGTNAYDPFGPLERKKIIRLRSIVRQELQRSSDAGLSPLGEYYLTLILPKDRWPCGTFGWLTDLHMTSVMNMFRRRSMLTPTPYKSDRIAFLDPHFCAMWCANYNVFVRNPKQFTFSQNYFDMWRGESPEHCVTNKHWLRDVDTLFAVHNIRDIHWVALEISLLNKRINVYDCSQSAVSEAELQESIKPFTRMIPYLINKMAPNPGQTASVKAFSWYKVRSVPINKRGCDCGVYALKFIECRALEHSFGPKLDDKFIELIRLKYAIDIMDELPLPETISTIDPNSRGWDAPNAAVLAAADGLLLDW